MTQPLTRILLTGLLAIPAPILAQTDSLGLSWQREILAGTGVRVSEFTTVVAGPGGSIYAGGSSESPTGETDLLLVRYDSQGMPIWEATYNGTVGGHDAARSLFLNADGGVTVVGEGAAAGGNALTDRYQRLAVIAARYTASGERLWAVEYTTGGDTLIDILYAAVSRSAGAAVLFDEVGVSVWPEGRRAVLLWITAEGRIGWKRGLPDNARPVFQTSCVLLDGMGKILVVATREDTAGAGSPRTTSCIYRFGQDGELLEVLDQHAGPTSGTRAVAAAVSPAAALLGVCFESDSVRYLRCYGGDSTVLWQRAMDTLDAPGWSASPYEPRLHFTPDSLLWVVRYNPGMIAERYSPAGDRLSIWHDDAVGFWPPAVSVPDAAGGLRILRRWAIVDEQANDSLLVQCLSRAGGLSWRTTVPYQFAAAEGVAGVVDGEGYLTMVSATGSLRDARALLAKIAPQGDVRWINLHSSAGAPNASVTCIARGAEDDILVTGTALNTRGYFDIFTARYSAMGEPRWLQLFASPVGRHVIPVKVLPDAGGRVLVAGYVPTSGPWPTGNGSYVLVSYRQDGSPAWSALYPRARPAELRGAGLDGLGRTWLVGSGGTVCVDTAGAVVLEDTRSSWAVTSDAAGRVFLALDDSLLARDRGGASVWSQAAPSFCLGLLPDGEGGVLGTNGFRTERFDSGGNFLWQRSQMNLGLLMDGSRNIFLADPWTGCVTGLSIEGDSLFSLCAFAWSDLAFGVQAGAMSTDGLAYLTGEGGLSYMGPPSVHLLVRGVSLSGAVAAGTSFSGPREAYQTRAMCAAPGGGIIVASDMHVPGMYRIPVLQRYDRLVVGVLEEKEVKVPPAFRLVGNYPNPFNPVTTIRFEVPAGGGDLSVKVYDVLGREVAVLAEGAHTPGVHTVRWNASAMASGMYLCRLRAGDFTATVKMLVVK